MRVLVTGGAGFIGSHLVAYLVKAGHEVVVLDALKRGNKLPQNVLQAVKFVQGDVRDSDLVHSLAEGCEAIYHLAAVLGVDVVADNPLETMDVEVLGMRNVVNACTLHGIKKVIYSSTSGVYGKRAIEAAVTETLDPSPSSSYSIAKRFNELYLASAYQERGLQSISARFFNVYGPGQDERMVLPRFVSQAMKGEPITVFGSGQQTRDFTYVEDSVHALVELANRVDGCEVFNICKGNDITIQEVAQIIKKYFNSSSEVVNITPPQARYDFEVAKRNGNSEKLFQAIGYRPQTSFLEGFQKTYHDLASHAGGGGSLTGTK